VKLKNKVKWN